jgi:hypothetical protein
VNPFALALFINDGYDLAAKNEYENPVRMVKTDQESTIRNKTALGPLKSPPKKRPTGISKIP